MAEIVTVLLDRLIPLISRQANLLTGIHREVETIKDELESITSFLVEADAREARGDSNEFLRTWVKQVRDMAYCMQDVMDEYMYHVARRSQKQGIYRYIRMTDRSFRKLVTRHGIALKLEDIKNKVVEIKNRADRYGQIGSTQQQTTHSQIASHLCSEDELVGMEGPRDELLSWFGEDGGGKRMVFSVVGMGGLGKTTLTRTVYDSQIGRFDCHAWITVSQTFIKEELLKSIIRQFYQSQKEAVPPAIETMDENGLVSELRTYVGRKRYVVVFDDVWTRTICEDMLRALPECYKSSRIIFTTRSEDVAPSSAQSSIYRVYKLPLLSFEESFELFCKRVFQTCNEGLCPPGLMVLSEGIVKKCDGLPLAIVTVGGVLSNKEKNISEWKKFHDSLGSTLQSDEQLTRVLSLSYHDLSPNLKSCLLYFSIYPEDCSIRCSRLIRQWIAEGFVKARNNEELEDVAEEYLNELIRLCVIQVSEVDECGRVRECRVHDLMREVILSKSQDMRFCSVFDGTVDSKCRRLSMVRDDPNMNVVYDNNKVSLIRSLFVFQRNEFSKRLMKVLFGNLKLVTILDFEGSGVKLLHKSVGDLFHLKYLSVRNTMVEKLPESIGQLEQLETLDTKGSRVRELPIEIKRLRKLRHLLAYSYMDEAAVALTSNRRGVKIQGGLGCWETLQKLYDVEADSGTIIEDLINFRKLRKLGLAKVRSSDAVQLCKAIEKMKELRSLKIKVADAEQVLDLKSIHSPPQFLLTVSLHSRLEALPSWIAKLQNLVRLELCGSGLTDDPFGVLQNLPNLLDLGMSDNAYWGDQLHFKRGKFPKLKSLTLLRLEVLNHFIIEEGALPRLENMVIGSVSPQMMEVPSSIRHLTNLRLMSFVDFSEEFCMKMVPEGPCWSIIQHIPRVVCKFFDCATGRYDYFTLADYQRP